MTSSHRRPNIRIQTCFGPRDALNIVIALKLHYAGYSINGDFIAVLAESFTVDFNKGPSSEIALAGNDLFNDWNYSCWEAFLIKSAGGIWKFMITRVYINTESIFTSGNVKTNLGLNGSKILGDWGKLSPFSVELLVQLKSPFIKFDWVDIELVCLWSLIGVSSYHLNKLPRICCT